MSIAEEKKQLLKEIEEIEKLLEPKRKRLNQLYREEADNIEAKINQVLRGKNKFSLDELTFAAYSKCQCGAGLAYPKNSGIHGSWYCSDILLGRAIDSGQPGAKMHDEGFPFAFYEIKSEDQPSANGATTRLTT